MLGKILFHLVGFFLFIVVGLPLIGVIGTGILYITCEFLTILAKILLFFL